jgi:predicted RNA binding protein YcfA (HicA-like mRNA interferase family)
MSAKQLDTCRSGEEFIRYACAHGAVVDHGKGSHFKVMNERGMCVVPKHPGDLGKGLRCKIVKLFTAMGLALFLALALLACMTMAAI